jgi:hypothetical protein
MSGQLDVDVRNTSRGQVFDFDVSGDFVALGVIVKGGPNANVYDYSPGGATVALNISGDAGLGDTGLHALNNTPNRFYGLSHLEFCFIEAPQTGAIEISKTAKHADSGTSPNLVAGFTITDSAGNTHAATTDANGDACVDGLPLGSATVSETTPPAGYAADADQTVEVVESTCTAGDGVVASFENAPLTDVSIDVTGQVPGGTMSTIDCDDGSTSGDLADPASLDITDVEPGTLVCTIVIDP